MSLKDKIEEVRKRLDTSASRAWSFGIVGDKDIEVYPQAPCYASFNKFPEDRDYDEDARPYRYLIAHPNYHRQQEYPWFKHILGYTQWLLNDSPWSRFYETKDPEEAIKHGVVIPLDEMHYSMAMQTACLFRMPREFTYCIEAWTEFCQYVGPLDALFISHYSGNITSTFRENPYYIAHSWVNDFTPAFVYSVKNGAIRDWKKFPASRGARGPGWAYGWLKPNNLPLTDAHPEKRYKFEIDILRTNSNVVGTFSSKRPKDSIHYYNKSAKTKRKFLEATIKKNTLTFNKPVEWS